MIFCFECSTNESLQNQKNRQWTLAGDTFMPEMHLKQPEITYCASRPFTKNKERIQKLKKEKNRRFKRYI